MPEFSSVIFRKRFGGQFRQAGESSCPAVAPQSSRIRKDVVLVGVQDRIEIWDKALWEERSQISEEDLDAIAERMESIGIRI